MLWKQLKPSYRKLLRKGSTGEAVIVRAAKDESWGGSGRGGATGTYFLAGWNVTVRVTFDDGSSAEFERYIENPLREQAGHEGFPAFEPGDTLPIRFDPTDHSQVEIDTGALWPWKGPREGDRMLEEGRQAIDDARRIWQLNLEKGLITQEQFDEQMRMLDAAGS